MTMMPGGNQANQLSGYSTIGPRLTAERKSRKGSKSSSSQPELRSVTDPSLQVQRQESTLEHVQQPEAETHFEKNVNSHYHSRSRIGKFFNSVSMPFTRPRSRSAVPTVRAPLSPPQEEKPAVPTVPSTSSIIDILNVSINKLKPGGEPKVPSPVPSPLLEQSLRSTQFADGRLPGVVGLRNHGNTCFMNAILQCLSNTEQFAQYFVTDFCRSDILAAKRAGRSCVITEQLGQLLASLWMCEYRFEKSLEFRMKVGEHAIQYRDTEQNDAQEFLEWLLSHINEELHGSSNLPENSTSSCDTKDVTTNGSTNGHRSLRIVHDLFLAQFRSTITCPHCGKHSCKLDPFLLVPLPISEKYKIPVYTTVIRNHPTPGLITVAAMLSTADIMVNVRHRIAGRTNIPAAQLVLMQVSNDFGFARNYDDNELLSDVENELSNLIAVQIVPDLTYPLSSIAIIALNIALTSTDCVRKFGYPFTIRVPRDTPALDLRMMLLNGMKDLLKENALQQMQELSGMFRMRLFRGDVVDCSIPDNVDIPLYMTEIDETLVDCRSTEGPQHIKITLEWDNQVYKRYIVSSSRRVTPTEDTSVKQVKSESQHLSAATLDDCFRDFTQQERLGTNDLWYCSNCKQRRSGAIKTLSLSSLPDVMVVQLKRFKQESENRTKLNALIQFPVKGLDMRRHLETPDGDTSFTECRDCLYDLYAVCNHIGDLHGGHYTAFCKNPVNGRWYKFDDEKVTSLRNESDVVTKTAYLLYYQRRAAIRRFDQSLRDWIGAICSASGPVRNADSRHQSPRHFRSGNIPVSRSSTIISQSGNSQFYVQLPHRQSQQFSSSGSMRSSRSSVHTGNISHAARKAILQSQHRTMLSSASDFNYEACSYQPGAGRYANIHKSRSHHQMAQQTSNRSQPMDLVETSEFVDASRSRSAQSVESSRADIGRSRTLPSNGRRRVTRVGLTSNSQDVAQLPAASQITNGFDHGTVLDRSTTAVTSSESDVDITGSTSTSPAKSPVKTESAIKSTVTNGLRPPRQTNLVFEKVDSTISTETRKITLPVHESSV